MVCLRMARSMSIRTSHRSFSGRGTHLFSIILRCWPWSFKRGSRCFRSQTGPYRPYFQFHMLDEDGGVHVSAPILALDGEYYLPVSRRLSAVDRSFAGVVVATLRLSYFYDQFARRRRCA